MNLLYVGGRPSTRLFRFNGTISNLFISNAALPRDTIIGLHNQALPVTGSTSASQINTVTVPARTSGTVRCLSNRVKYCKPKVPFFGKCYVQNSASKDFRYL